MSLFVCWGFAFVWLGFELSWMVGSALRNGEKEDCVEG